MKEKQDERRANERFKCSNKCTGKLITADKITIKNISLGGLCLETSKRLTNNGVYRVELVLDNNENITPICIVTWSSIKGTVKEKNNTLPLHDIGLKFIYLKENEKHFIEKLIKELA